MKPTPALLVLALVLPLLLGAEAPPKKEPAGNRIEITADWFEADNTTRTAVYKGNVTVIDPPPRPDLAVTRLTCGRLTVVLPATGKRIDNIIAENSVVIEQGENRATGAKAIYSATNDTITLSGNPVLHTKQGRLYSSQVIFDRANNNLRAVGPVRTEIDADSIGAAGGGLFPPGGRDLKKDGKSP